MDQDDFGIFYLYCHMFDRFFFNCFYKLQNKWTKLPNQPVDKLTRQLTMKTNSARKTTRKNYNWKATTQIGPYGLYVVSRVHFKSNNIV